MSGGGVKQEQIGAGGQALDLKIASQLCNIDVTANEIAIDTHSAEGVGEEVEVDMTTKNVETDEQMINEIDESYTHDDVEHLENDTKTTIKPCICCGSEKAA